MSAVEFDLIGAKAALKGVAKPSARAVVAALHAEIATALANGATYRAIAAALAACGCHVTPGTLKFYRWTRKRPVVRDVVQCEAVGAEAVVPPRPEGAPPRRVSSVMEPKSKPRAGDFNRPLQPGKADENH